MPLSVCGHHSQMFPHKVLYLMSILLMIIPLVFPGESTRRPLTVLKSAVKMREFEMFLMVMPSEVCFPGESSFALSKSAEEGVV